MSFNSLFKLILDLSDYGLVRNRESFCRVCSKDEVRPTRQVLVSFVLKLELSSMIETAHF